MSNIYEPFDFEEEHFKPTLPLFGKKKNAHSRKKLTGLDDLLEDYEREQKKIKEKESRKRKIWKTIDSDEEDEDDVEAKLSVCVDQCQKEINQINGDDATASWGIQVFGHQRRSPQHDWAELKNPNLLHSFMNSDNSLVELNIEKGEDFLEGLLTNGMLYQLVCRKRCVEKSIATWTFNSMLYSSKMGLIEAACEFWCKILLLKVDSSGFRLDWLPKYSDLKRALDTYGFLLDEQSRISSDIDMTPTDSNVLDQLRNITSWIKFTAACCKTRRSKHRIFSTGEAEEVLTIIFYLFLERKLLGLSSVLSECLASAISFFSNDEWHDSCQKVANSLACRLPGDMNCLKLVMSVMRFDGRSKQLKSVLSFRLLMKCLDEKVCDAEEVLRSLCSINVKDKKCDLVKFYICLRLAESWLSDDPVSKDDAALCRLWGGCLKKSCSAITITDFRSYASDVRSKASYLLQSTRS